MRSARTSTCVIGICSITVIDGRTAQRETATEKEGTKRKVPEEEEEEEDESLAFPLGVFKDLFFPCVAYPPARLHV